MSSVIIELQREALDRNVPVSDLLRKSFVVSRKLGLHEFRSWIEKELTGYGDSDTPEYREVRGQIRGWNPYNGWIPLYFEDFKDAERYSKRKTSQSIAQLEHLVNPGEDQSTLQMPFSHEVQQRLSTGFGFPTQVSLFTDRVAILGIIDAVRTILLNWSLKLEEDGILGEGLAFSVEEKDAAAQTPQSITNFFGPVQNVQVQQDSPGAVQIAAAVDIAGVTQFIERFQPSIGDLGLSPEYAAELQSEVEILRAQVNSPKPKPAIIRDSLGTIRRVLEGAAGGAGGQFLIELARLLGG